MRRVTEIRNWLTSRGHSEAMPMALLIWLCTLPLVALLILPFFGPRIAAVTALALLLLLAIVCWGVCARPQAPKIQPYLRPTGDVPPAQSLLRLPSLPRLNLWMAVALMALSGWLIDSLLVGLRLHNLPEAGSRVHLWHLWYGPLFLVGGLLLIRRYRPELMQWVASLPKFEVLARHLRPEVKTLARHVVGSETPGALLAFLQRHPTMAITASDLAGQVGGDIDDIEPALRKLEVLGLVETQCVCDMTFYRLTTNAEGRRQLHELVAWQEGWLEHAEHLAHAVGPRLAKGHRVK